MPLSKSNLLQVVKVEVSKWFLENFGESLDAILNDSTRRLAAASKRAIVAQALYMLGFNTDCLAEILGRSTTEVRSYTQLKDPFTTATALDLHAYMAKFVEAYFVERLLELSVNNSRLNYVLDLIKNEVAVDAEIELFINKRAPVQYDTYKNNVYNYYVKRMREKHKLYQPKTIGQLRDEA